MKKLKKNEFTFKRIGQGEPNKFPASKFIEYAFYDSFTEGTIERNSRGIEKTQEAFGRLVEILYRRNIINRKDVYEIANEEQPENEL